MKHFGLLLTVLVLLLAGFSLWRQGAGRGAVGSEDREIGLSELAQVDPRDPVASRRGAVVQERADERLPVGAGISGQVHGVVVDPLSLGVEGARVTLLRREDVGRLGAGSPVIRSTVTDQRGAFGWSDVGMGSYIVLVRAEGFALGRSEMRLSRHSPVQRGIRLVLTRGQALEGEVVDEHGQGVEGAWVIVSGLRGIGVETEVRSGREGRFVFPALPRGRAQVLAWAEGHGLGIAEREAGAVVPLRVVLPAVRPYRISLRLAEPEEPGVPRPGDVTALLRYAYGDTLISLPSPIRHYDIPSEGEVQTSPLCEGRFLVETRSQQVVMARPWYRADLGGQTLQTGIEIVWQEGQPLQGQLVFADGRPAAEVLVQVWSRDSRDPYTSKSDSRGRFAFAKNIWTSHDVTLRLVSKGYLFVLEGKNRRWTQITGGDAENRCTVESIPVWRGRVIDDEGRPVPAAQVWLEAMSGEAWRIGNAMADGDGRFEIALDQDFRKPLYLGARSDGRYCPEPLIVNPVGPGPTENLELRLTRAASIEGRVVDGRGIGLPDVEVMARHVEPDPRDPAPVGGPRSQGRWQARRKRSDDQGRFRIPSLPHGSWRLEARAPGRSKSVEDPVVLLARGEIRKGLELVLREGLSIAGRIVDEAGEPIPMVSIRGKFEGKIPAGGVEPAPTATTAFDGRFELSGLHAGPYLLSAHPSSSVQRKLGLFEPGPDGHVSMRYDKPFTMRAMAGSKDLRWRLERVRLGEIRAQLVHRGAPLRRIRVELHCSKPMGIWEYQMPVEKGLLSVPRVVSGSYLVKIGGSRFETVTRKVEVRTEEIADLGLLTLTEYPQVEGRVQDPSGHPLVGVWIGLDARLADLWPKYDLAKGREQFAGRVLAESDAQGGFRLPIPGSARIFAFKPGYAPAELAWSVTKDSSPRPGEPEPLVLQLPPAAELGIRAPAPVIGKPSIWGARLTPMPPGSVPAAGRGRPAGARHLWLEAGKVLRFVGLPPGRYRLEALDFNKSTRFRAESVAGLSYHEEIDVQLGTRHVIRIP